MPVIRRHAPLRSRARHEARGQGCHYSGDSELALGDDVNEIWQRECECDLRRTHVEQPSQDTRYEACTNIADRDAAREATHETHCRLTQPESLPADQGP